MPSDLIGEVRRCLLDAERAILEARNALACLEVDADPIIGLPGVRELRDDNERLRQELAEARERLRGVPE